MGANEWAKRLGINDAASLETFKQKFSQLEDAAKECPVPPKDGSRCALCRRKVMLDTRFKELCNGLCSAGGSTKSTKKTINAVNSASKILEIYRSLPAAGAGAAPLRNIDESDGGIVGLSRLGESRDSESSFQILCRSEQCQPVWKSTSVSGAPDNSSLSHFSAMTRPTWLGRAARNRHRHAIEQASRRCVEDDAMIQHERAVKF